MLPGQNLHRDYLEGFMNAMRILVEYQKQCYSKEYIQNKVDEEISKRNLHIEELGSAEANRPKSYFSMGFRDAFSQFRDFDIKNCK